MKKLMLALLLGLLLGCAAHRGSVPADPGSASPEDFHALATETANEMVRRKPPAMTAFVVQVTDTSFGPVLASELSKRGFASSGANATPVSYALDVSGGYAGVQVTMGNESFGVSRLLGEASPASSASSGPVFTSSPGTSPDPVIGGIVPVGTAPISGSAPMMVPAEHIEVVTMPPVRPTWDIQAGTTLREQLRSWADNAGYSLVWEPQSNYELRNPASFTGSFEDAVRALFQALASDGLALRVTIYQGNNVIRVQEH